MKRVFATILCFLSLQAVILAQVPMKLSYEMVGGKMRIKVFVNGEPQSFMFDTGGKTTITKELQQAFGFPPLDSIPAIDVTSKKHSYARHLIPSLQFENKEMNISDVPALVLEEGSMVFSVFDCVGIIGHDIISHFVMEIDAREQAIHLLPESHRVTASLRNMIKFETENNEQNMPLFTIGLDVGETLRVLFDTGAYTLLSVNPSEYDRLKGTNAVSNIKEGISRSIMGISGTLETTEDIRLTLPLVSMGTQKFNHVNASVMNVPISLLGTPILKYGKVIIDYPRSRFFIEPFYKGPIAFTAKSWDIGLTVSDGGLYIASLWGDKRNEANIGDRVIRVDGNDIPTLDFADVLKNGLNLLKDKDQVELTVESNGGTKMVMMEKD